MVPASYFAKGNRLLQSLLASDLSLLAPNLVPMELLLRQSMEKPNQRIDDVFFNESAIASVVASPMRDVQVEIGLAVDGARQSPGKPARPDARIPGALVASRRAGVTEGLKALTQQELISARRGEITVHDRKGLEKVAGKFYGIPEAEYRRLVN